MSRPRSFRAARPHTCRRRWQRLASVAALLAAQIGIGALPAAAQLEAGNFLVIDSSAFPLTGNRGGVLRYTSALTPQLTVASGGLFVDPVGAAFDAAGDLLVVDRSAFAFGAGGVIRVNPLTRAASSIPPASPSRPMAGSWSSMPMAKTVPAPCTALTRSAMSARC